MKKTIALLLLSLSLATFIGCKSNDTDYYQPNVQMKSSNFNQESYVWESFLFNTNSTSRTLRR